MAATKLKEVNVQAMRPTITQEADRMVVSVEGSAMAAGNTAFTVLARSPGVFVDAEGNIQLNGRSGVTVMIDDYIANYEGREIILRNGLVLPIARRRRKVVESTLKPIFYSS